MGAIARGLRRNRLPARSPTSLPSIALAQTSLSFSKLAYNIPFVYQRCRSEEMIFMSAGYKVILMFRIDGG
jgi:hypothetical protein